MTPEETAPERLWQQEDGTLVLEWRDGHQTTLTPEELRCGCPCAVCRDARETAPASAEAAPPARTELRRIERVGLYAVTPVWGDGHDAGIYSWTHLRRMCGCVQCRLERGEL